MKNPFRGWGMDIFWNHTITNSRTRCNRHYKIMLIAWSNEIIQILSFNTEIPMKVSVKSITCAIANQAQIAKVTFKN